jgi:hypothetical protein
MPRATWSADARAQLEIARTEDAAEEALRGEYQALTVLEVRGQRTEPRKRSADMGLDYPGN